MDASTTTADSAMSGDKKHDVSVYIDLPTRQRIIDYMGVRSVCEASGRLQSC